MTAQDRVRAHTASEVLARIDIDTKESLARTAAEGTESMGRRVEALDREWDVDRTVEAEASIMALSGLALGVAINRHFYKLPGVVASMVLVYSLHGWYPLLPLFRRLGLRTAKEIYRERYALKAMRGDFDSIPGLSGQGVRTFDGREIHIPAASALDGGGGE